MTELYETRHVGLAAFLLYQRSDLYVSTQQIGPASTMFSFSNPEDCVCLEVVFFSQEGVAVADAKALLECSRTIRQTIAQASRSQDGTYRPETA
jgi:hypothetical protein